MSQEPDAGEVAEPFYHCLTVKAVRDETAQARSFVLVPERGEAALFRYRPGQFLTFRLPTADGTVLRSYSLSSTVWTEPDMTVCVKRVAGGLGSNWFHDQVMAGSRVEAARPAGRFVLQPGDKPLFLIAGGSGITPCISLVKQALADSKRRVKLVYANQDAASVIYIDQLDRLVGQFGGRFDCMHWLDDARGFMSVSDVIAQVQGWEASDCYVCGPAPLMEMAEETLAEHLGDAARILTERFLSPEVAASPTATEAPAPVTSVVPDGGAFDLILDGQTHKVPITAGQTLLAAALAAGIDAPNSCTEGHCGTCMAQLRAGEVSMVSTQALSKRNIQRGLVLACQARPSSTAKIVLDFDF